MNLFREICPAQGTLSFDCKPFLSTFLMEIVLRVAIERNQLIVIIECYQANHAIRHICVLRLILIMRLLVKGANVLL